MTDDLTELQTDTKLGVPQGGPARKWFYQRLMAMTSFGCVLWWPLVVWVHPEAKSLTSEWFLFHGAVVGAWFGGSTWSAVRR